MLVYRTDLCQAGLCTNQCQVSLCSDQCQAGLCTDQCQAGLCSDQCQVGLCSDLCWPAYVVISVRSAYEVIRFWPAYVMISVRPTGRVFSRGIDFNVAIFSDTENPINVTLCLMVRVYH